MLTMKPLCVLFLASTVLATDTAYTFPAKSVNLNAAYTTDWFAAHTLGSGTGNIHPAMDAHAVHGIQLADGGYILTGKALEADGSTVTEAFATKLSATGSIVWGWKSGIAGKDAANAAAQLPNGEVLIAGYRTVGGILKRSITKLNVDTGVEIWTATEFGDTAGSFGAYEMINIDATHGAILCGLTNKPDASEMSFKSYGNVAAGQAVVQTLPLTTLSGTTAPSASDITRTKAYSTYTTSKNAHFVSATSAAVLLWKENNGATFAVFNPSDGADIVPPVDHGSEIGEGTDMQIVGTTHAVITGQKTPNGMSVGYSGRLTKISLSDGSLVWTKEYSSCGAGTVAGAPLEGQCSKGLIYNECWGVAVMGDGGFVLSCGTGIENCPNTMSGQMLTDCNAGRGDRRAGAYPRAPSVWDAFTVKTSSDGTLEWQRADSFKAASWPPLVVGAATAPSQVSSTAGEWPIPINSGTGVAIVTDQVEGIGLLKMVGGAPTPPPTVNPNPKKILTVGDSWAEYSGNTFTDFCSGAQQINRGIGGTTAVQWTAGTGDNNFADALTAAGTMNGNDIVVLSVGGNDWIGINCQGKTLTTLQGEIQDAANALITAITNTGCGTDCPAIWMFGYAMVAAGSDGCAAQGPAALANLKTAIANVAAATTQVNYHDITSVCGGSSTALSPTDPCFGMGGGADNIHMNKRGYCKVIAIPAVQTGLGCATRTYNCATVPKDLTAATRTAAKCTTYGSCPPPTPTAAPTIGGPTPPPTPAPTSVAVISQSIVFTGLSVAAYTGTVKATYEQAYGISIGVTDSSGNAIGGSVVTSVASSRRSTTVAFTATIPTLATNTVTAAKTNSAALSPATFMTSYTTAATNTGASGNAPTASAMTVQAATCIGCTGASSEEDGDGGTIIGVVVGLLVLCCIGAAVYHFLCKSPSDSKMAQTSDISTSGAQSL